MSATPVGKPLCTVLIPFDAAGQARFSTLESIGEALGYRTMRVAQYYSSGMILEEIVRSIRDAHLIIADLTRGNPNVCYELGLAHALGKRVFLVAEDPQSCRIDFGRLTVNKFDAAEPGRERLSDALRAFVATPGILSPIDVFSGGLAVAGQPLTARRFCGFLIDTMIAGVVAAALLALAAWMLRESAVIDPQSAIVPLMLLYFVLAGIALGTTPGQRLMGLRVTRLDRSEPSRWQKLLRPLAAVLTLMTFGISFLWAARSPRHQAVHDIITRTLVLRNGVRPRLVRRRASSRRPTSRRARN